MNNQQFRKLLADQPGINHDEATKAQQRTASPVALGGRKSGSLGMAPRALKRPAGTEISRALRGGNGQPSSKKFKSSAPRGSAIASGFIDRARARAEAENEQDEGDKAKRIKLLEEQLKSEQISRTTFERLRDEIAGGNISSTHLIKGLDRKLLDRVRRGEDVLSSVVEPAPEPEVTVDVDDALDKLEDAAVETVQKEKVEKKGTVAPAVSAGKKRTRDEIMAELKAQRKVAEQPVFDSRWRRVGDKSTSRIEIDRKGREVLVIVDENGVVKKKVRKVPKTEETTVQQANHQKEVLGADIVLPGQLKTAPEEDVVDHDDVDDEDIFEGAGTDYDPLGPDEPSEDEEKAFEPQVKQEAGSHSAADALTHKTAGKRNYFGDQPTAIDEPLKDHLAGIKAVIERAGKLKTIQETDPGDEAEAARRARHAQMLANQDRDLEDMDMGFGASRFEDGEDGGDEKIRLSEWNDNKHDPDKDSDDKRNHDKKKRKPKKRKGDASSFADIMTVIERRKEAKT